MNAVSDPGTQEIVDKIVAIVRERVPDSEQAQVEHFVRQYFAGTAAADLAENDCLNLYGLALAHWNFARQREPGVPKLRVYNPQFDQHGWQSTHTIVEIVNDDMPFLVDSVRMALNARRLTTHLIIHPVMQVRRDERGHLLEVLDLDIPAEDGVTEAVMHFEVDRQTEKDVLDGIDSGIRRVLGDVRVAVEDWRAMRGKLEEMLAELREQPPRGIERDEFEEARAFLEWIDANHFTFLGYREYELVRQNGEDTLRSVPDSGLGILRNPDSGRTSESFSKLPREARERARKPELLVVTKANSRATVHRPGYLDYVGVKRFDEQGEVVGERRFLGLYTSAAYNRVPRDIPLLRRKVAQILERAGYPENSHASKTLQNILDTFPRDELFQVPSEALFETVMGILHLQERQRIRLFVHRDVFGRFFSCIVYVPRERFNTQVRERIQGILEESFQGTSTDFTVQLSESVLARLYFVIRVPPGTRPDYDVAAIEKRLVEVTRSWTDDLYDALLDRCGEELGTRLFRRYGDGFPAAYREQYAARTAVFDVEKMEIFDGERDLAMTLYRPLEAAPTTLNFKLFRAGRPISLSEAMPMLENMGLKVVAEQPAEIERTGDDTVWMHDFEMLHGEEGEVDLDETRDLFQEAFARIWRGHAESDGFNRLVLRAQLSWREIVILRAYCKYLRQARFTFSQDYMVRALVANPHIAQRLVRLFHARFDPERQSQSQGEVARLTEELEAALDAVASLDEDRILRSILTLIQATLRTNYYQCGENEEPKTYVSFKFNPTGISLLPEPRPMFEIFVYSPRVEGVHLRGGKVARGGLRWSDRPEDFRTEILGLVKAQIVKNAVIVPVGAKGGFVPKRLPSGDREAIQREGVACYQIFIRGLLDVTDNLVDGKVQPPRDVVRHDEDDPYLVVAADKGTATFSDIANGIAEEYGFWLGDAFASGGSKGYDHKKMGITARGAWESVKRHFRELGLDTQSEEFTVVGIGDMAGDVFGNGMLLSRHIKLVGAFNHMHVFIDPDPDPEASYRERERLFRLPRSSWDDYDRSVISEGGGVYPRSAKSIDLSPQARRALGVDAARLTPNEVIRAMLKAPVDLLWNGGIGTYVKARSESNADVGDRANDALRVNGAELGCRVVGEGGNLGLTQLGRIEFALNGGRVYTDAIDNSGGVDCSDHEVNIKILLNSVVRAGDLTEKQRNELLSEMTEEVAKLVLRNNYLQSQVLSLAASQAPAMLDVHSRLIRFLERHADLDRELEGLPSNDEMLERASAGRGLVAPEFAVMLAHCKIHLFESLLDSDLPADPYLVRELEAYFPTPLRERFRDRMMEHRLWREIISTQVANGMVNRAGTTFAFRLAEETGAESPDIARAYLAARAVFDMPGIWRDIERLDNRVPTQTQYRMLLEGRKLEERASRWLLRNRGRPLHISKTIEYFQPGVKMLAAALPELVGAPSRESMARIAQELEEAGVPAEVAQRVSTFTELFSALDIVEVANRTEKDVSEVAQVYFALGAKLDLHWLRDQIVVLPRDNRWQALARAALRDDLYNQERELAADILRTQPDHLEASRRIDDWMQRNATAVARCRQILEDLKSGPTPDFAMLSVAMREIRGLRALDTPAARREAPKGAAAGRRKRVGTG